jgi:hypothetical protein
MAIHMDYAQLVINIYLYFFREAKFNPFLWVVDIQNLVFDSPLEKHSFL